MKRLIPLLLIVSALISLVSCQKGVNALNPLANVKVGDVIEFGVSDRKEKITWKILAVEDGKVLAVTTDGIDCQLYNTEAIETSWENCSLRKWLNGTFLKNAFDSVDLKRILTTEVACTSGNSVKDELFLLSIAEVQTYFPSDEERSCKPAKLATQNGAYTDAATGNCAWWLRDSGSSAERAALVTESGKIDENGEGVYCDGNAVRPAMWISTSSDPGVLSENSGKSVTSVPSSTTKKNGSASSKPLSSHGTPVYPTDQPLVKPEKKDRIANILVIGNSCAYYFMDELERIADAAGYQVNVYNAYYALSSGNQVDAHWANLTFQKHDSNKNTYKFYKTAKGSRQQLGKSITLEGAVSYTDWDVVVMNESVRPRKSDTYEAMYKNTVEDAKRIYDYIKEMQPNAALFWYQGFSYEIGWTASNDESEYMTTVERQDRNHENIKLASKLICQQNEIGLLPVGDAWQLARKDPAFGQHLTERWQSGNHLEDHYHDGESGGQYLNACVFFEVIFQKSCVGNTFFPQAGGELEYELTPEKVKRLQEIAHKAVASVYGNDFAQ